MLASGVRTLSTMAQRSANSFKLALVQMAVKSDKALNLQTAEGHIKEAAENGADIVTLPECFNSPYGTSFFPEYAEPIPGPSTDCLSSIAKKYGVHVVGGSIPERDGDKLYNTCTVYNRQGEMVAKHRKVHLFDIDVPGKIRFQESETLTGGSDFTTFDTEFCKVGVGICYDIRFAEMAMIYAQQGCKLLLYPGAFNMTTGPAHWELLLRSRANDNQMFVAAASPARDTTATYHAWGHSTVVDPWGTVLSTTEHESAIVYAIIDLDRLDEVRSSIPITKQHRHDLYMSPAPVAK